MATHTAHATVPTAAIERKGFTGAVRRAFRWMNFHFREDGKIIRQAAKQLPPDERRQAIEYGKDFMVARSKKGFPRAFRNVTVSLLVGQGMWYGVCPLLSKIPGIRETPFGWLLWGGSDKLFLSADQLLYHTGGYSSSYAAQLSAKVPKTVFWGGLMLGIELATDFSRCFIEYWTQKKYGIVADGVARAYGQVRPFSVRYSSLEAYQKIISYILRPWTIGTPSQIFSSVQGFMGSLWRTGSQLAVVCTVGKWLDNFFKKVSEWTGLKKLADRIIDSAKEKEQRMLEGLKGVLGEDRFMALSFQLAEQSKKFWSWNPFKPALSAEKAMEAVEVTTEFGSLQQTLAKCKDPDESVDATVEFINGITTCSGKLEGIFGRKRLLRAGPYAELAGIVEKDGWENLDVQALETRNSLLRDTLEDLQTERFLA